MKDPESYITPLFKKADIRIGGTRPQDIVVHNKDCYRRMLTDGSLGLGESYVDGHWDANALDAFFAALTSLDLRPYAKHNKLIFPALFHRFFNPQSYDRSKRVAEMHYNLGNQFYGDMLDPWMQYTCGYWQNCEDLNQAQEAKLHLICQKLQLQAGERLLELGGGWGGLAKFAAQHYGVEVTSYNISTEQVKFAREFCGDLPVTIELKDYREATGSFDKVVSVGMCEHIGVQNYTRCFDLIRQRLKPGGLALIHTIGRNYSCTQADPWFRKYIFPGGQLPSIKQIAGAVEGRFVMEDFHNIGADYDRTLMAWYERYRSNWPKHSQKLGERFQRMWDYYLLSCAGAFRSRRLQLWQFIFSECGVPGGYTPVRTPQPKTSARPDVLAN